VFRTSVVDPHGLHLGDAPPKLRGLAEFTEQFGGDFHRIESVAEMKDKTLRVPDLKRAAVRPAIRDAGDVEHLYLSDSADDY
jgi:hypothetical protein